MMSFFTATSFYVFKGVKHTHTHIEREMDERMLKERYARLVSQSVIEKRERKLNGEGLDI